MLIETLKIFKDVAELKSFTRAAEVNFITQSAVSQQVRQLERHWKTVLLERSRRGVSLTRTGEVLYQGAKAMVDRYEEMNRTLGKVTQTIGGVVRVAVIHSIGLHELPPYVKRFMKLYPDVNLKIEYKHDRQIYKEILTRRSDLGLVAYPSPHPQLEVLPFRQDRLIIICHPSHSLAKHKSVKISKIQNEDFVAFERGIPTRKAIDKVLVESHVNVKIAMEFDNIETLKRAVEIGTGISIVPSATVKQEIEHKTLKEVEIADRPLIRPLGILLRKGRQLPVAVSTLARFLLD